MKGYTYAFCFLAALYLLTKVDAGVCPTEKPGIAWGCAYQPRCFSDSNCGQGGTCCPHTCGSFCHGGTSPGCTSAILCLLGRKK